MKKIIFIFLCLAFMQVYADTLKGGVTEDYIPDGFFGSWAVISKLQNATDTSLFNMESKDIWTLSGYADVLVLQNLQSGAISNIILKDKNTNGKTLKFERSREVKDGKNKTVYIEIVEFVLNGDKFLGSDTYIVQKYINGEKIKSDTAKYKVSGIKISGKSTIEN